jgi:hypothetical protein
MLSELLEDSDNWLQFGDIKTMDKLKFSGVVFANFIPPILLATFLLLIGWGCYAWLTEERAFYIFWMFCIVIAFLWPFLFSELQRTETDYIYYFLAIFGVLGFFASERLDSEQINSANRLSEFRKEIRFYDEALQNPEVFLDREDIKEVARRQLLNVFEEVKSSLNAPNSDCPDGYADWNTEYCPNRDRAADDAGFLIRRFSNRVEGREYVGRSAPARLSAQRILEIYYLTESGEHNPGGLTISVDALEPEFLRFSSVPLMDVYNYYTKPSRARKDYVSDASMIMAQFEFLRNLTNENLEAEQTRFDELDDDGKISWIEAATVNIWPYLLVVALTLKIARTRLQQVAN